MQLPRLQRLQVMAWFHHCHHTSFQLKIISIQPEKNTHTQKLVARLEPFFWELHEKSCKYNDNIYLKKRQEFQYKIIYKKKIWSLIWNLPGWRKGRYGAQSHKVVSAGGCKCCGVYDYIRYVSQKSTPGANTTSKVGNRGLPWFMFFAFFLLWKLPEFYFLALKFLKNLKILNSNSNSKIFGIFIFWAKK